MLSLDYDRLKAFFLRAMPGLPSLSAPAVVRVSLQLSVLLLPLLLLSIYSFPDKHPQLTGSYRVTGLSINGEARAARTPKDSVLTGVYLDLEDEFALDFNDYRYRYIGTYHYEPATDSLRVAWRYPAPSIPPLKGRLIRQGAGWRLDGQLGDQHLHLHLNRRP